MAGTPENKYGLDLRRAWAQVLSEVARDKIPDILHWQDYAHIWPEWERTLAEQLNNDTYTPTRPVHVEIPKDALATRPMALLTPLDRTVYQAIVDQLAPAIEAELTDAVYSARLKQSTPARTQVKPQIREWLRFQHAGRDLHLKDGYLHALTTDVASYFEYVDIEILIRDLRSLGGVSADSLSLLSRFLNEIQRNTNLWGLPQGPECSAILGNYYLLPADAVLAMHPVKHVRFQDDIKIFAHSAEVLRLAHKDVVHQMRARHLNLSVHKTKLLEGKQILEAFEDSRKDAIAYGLQIGDDAAPGDLRSLFDDATTSSPYKDRDIRFSVTRMADLDDPYAVPWILDHLPDVPYLAPQLVDYLSPYTAEDPAVERRVTEYLQDPTKNLYPFAELHLLRMYATAPRLTHASKATAWRTLRDPAKESFVRQFAARCIGRHASAADISQLRAMFGQSGEYAIRRAILVAIAEAGGADPAWLGTVDKGDTTLRPTCAYLKSKPRLPI